MSRTDAPNDRRDALAERLFDAVAGFNQVHMVYIGERLGLYRALADRGSVTAGELAQATGTDERYLREWLEQQAASGVLDVDEARAAPEQRRFSLPSGHDEVLVDRDNAAYMAAFARMSVGIVQPLPAVLDAFRTGAGVPYADYPADFCEGQGEMNRVAYVNELASWLASLPDVDERLRADPPARVADVACGTGASTLAIARAYPKVAVDGIDLDDASIAIARRALAGSGLDERVTFAVQDAADPSLAGRYDLVTVFEAVHDLSRPVEVLRALRGLLAEAGSVLVADERAEESFSAPAPLLEQLFYSWSVLHCLPVGRAEQPSAATGTVMRPAMLRRYAEEAGFGSFEIAPIEHEFWRFYRLA